MLAPFPRSSGMASLALLILAWLGCATVDAQTNPFDQPDPWRGKVHIPPGEYSPKHRIILGAKVNPTDKHLERATVTSEKGVDLEEADILIDEGHWQAEGTRFAKSRLQIDLGGSLVAVNSLFEDCEMSKGGVWFVKWHSSKWTFDHCVFTRRFISPLKINDIGIKAVHCTFHDVDFAVFQFRDDVAKELQNEWMTVRNCRFVRCNVPESFLLMTRDCVFDGCTFDPADKQIPTPTPVTVKVHLLNANSSKPKAGPNRTIVVIEGDIPAAGASAVRYRRTGKSLNFD